MTSSRTKHARTVLAGVCLSLVACGDGAPVPEDPTTLLPPGTRAEGAALAPESALAQLGCGACHPGAPGAEEVRREAPPLVEGGGRYHPGYLFAYLLDPRRTRADIGPTRMPDFHLDEREALALALHLGGDESPPDPGPPEPRGLDDTARAGLAAAWDAARDRYPDITAEQGAAIFRALNCAGCHGGRRWAPGPPLAGIGERRGAAWLREYLSAPRSLRPFGFVPGTGSRMPDYRLSPEEVEAVLAALVGEAATRDGTAAAATREAAARPADDVRPLSAFDRGQAEALLRNRLSCLGCHRYRGEGGRIGPELVGAAARLAPGALGAVVRNAPAVVPGTVMPRTLAPDRSVSLVLGLLAEAAVEVGEGAGMAGMDTAAVTDTGANAGGSGYLSLVDHPPLAPPAMVAGEGEGARLYRRHCASCHGARGEGDGYNARYLPVTPTAHADSAAMSQRPDDVLFDAIHAGGHIMGRSHRMPAFGGSLTAAEIRALVDHIRALCGCTGPAWSRDGRAGGGDR